MDALDLAILIEDEAQERYREFASLIGSRYKGDAASFFKMEKNEAKHGQELSQRRKALFGNQPARVDSSMILDVEAPEYSKAESFMAPYKALQIAYNGEVKAFKFFEQALLSVQDSEVKALFEELKKEELHHQDLLKEQMKKVPKDQKPDIDPDDVDEPPGL